MRFRAVCFIIGLLVATLNLIPISVPSNNKQIEQRRVSDDHIVPSAEGIIDEILLEDLFENAPLGFNDSLWNIEIYNLPTLSWVDSESLAMSSEIFTAATLESNSTFGPEVSAELEFTFTQGLCYFGIGWADQYIEPGEEWATNLRACRNGVFIDYCDTELFLVSYKDGDRVSTPIMNLNTTSMHTYKLIWHSSLVSLYIDGVESATISRHIPTTDMQFILTTSGHHYLVISDTLLVDRVTIGTLDWNYHDDIPEVSLLWPANNSQVYSFDVVDLEIIGQDTTTYSWDNQTPLPIYSPWDIDIPDAEGIHQLGIYSENITGQAISVMYQFEVVSEPSSIPVWDSGVKPVIDGVLSNQELNSMTLYNVSFRGEDRQSVSINILLGYYDESLYVGVVTPVPDRWYSHISLLVDGSGEGIWGDAETGTNEDIRITVSGPSLQNEFRGIYSHTGQEIQLVGVTYSTTVVADGLLVEYFIPVSSVGGNFSSGLGFGIITHRAGYDASYPVSVVENGCCNLLIAQSLGPRPQDTFATYLGSSIILIVFATLVIGVIFVRRKQGFLTIEETLENEPLERIRTLLLSHPQLSLERLALLANTDTTQARELIEQLRKKGLLEDSIEISETEIIRNNRASEKKHM